MVWAVGNAAQDAALKELIATQHSDRIVGIVGGAIFEDSLMNALKYRLRPDKGEGNADDLLFRVGGPLGSLVPKIELAYRLYMFEKPTRDTMYGINNIRNLFAHDLEMTFHSTDKRMVNAAKKLKLHEGRSRYPNPFTGTDSEHKITEPTDTVRDRFLVNLKLCLISLMGDGQRHAPWSNLPSFGAAG
jgi:hypothetical protein